MQAFIALILVIAFGFECYVASRIYYTYKLAKHEKQQTRNLLIVIHDKIRKAQR